MTALRELQATFALALVEPSYRGLDAHIVPGGITSERRTQVYRNNMFATLGGALEALYPVVRRLIGGDCFAALARRYVRQQPSLSGNLHDYGAHFPKLLSDAPETQALRYLPDVAGLEWACHQAFHAADTSPLGLEALTQLPAERWPGLRLELNPACALLQSVYPVLRIWQVNQEDWQGDMTVSLDEGPCQVLVGRRADELELVPLGRGEFALLRGLADGHPLEQAVTLSLDADSQFELGGNLEKHFRLGTFTSASLKPKPTT